MPRVVWALLFLPTTVWSQAPVKTAAEFAGDLRSVNPRIRFNAMAGLESNPDAADKAIPGLIKNLSDTYVSNRIQAAKTLSAYEEQAVPAAGPLLKALSDADFNVRFAAADALGKFTDKITPALVAALKDSTPGTRLPILQWLESLPEVPADITPALVQILTKEQAPTLKRAAFAVLTKIGVENELALQLMVQTLHDKDVTIRVAAAKAFLESGLEQWVHLVKAATDGTMEVRHTMLQALASKADDLDEVHIHALRKGLADGDSKVRQVALQALSTLKVKAREAGGGKAMFQAVAKLSTDGNLAVRRGAVWTLGQIGIDDLEELAQLAKSVKDSDVTCRGVAIQALSQYLHEETPEDFRKVIHEGLAQGLRDGDRRVQALAGELLAKEGVAALPALMGVLQKGGGISRSWAAFLLGELGAAAKDAAPLLEKMSKESTPEGKLVARAALQKILNP